MRRTKKLRMRRLRTDHVLHEKTGVAKPEEEKDRISMTRNRTVFIVLYIILCAALAVLFYLEKRYPEAGSEMMRQLLKLKA